MSVQLCASSRRQPSPQARRNKAVAAAAVAIIMAASAGAAFALDENRQRELTFLVRQDCGSCHGMTLNGGLGKPLTPQALAPLEADSIAYIILEGVPGQPMPPWKGLITAADAQWIAKRLKEGFPP